MVDRRGFIGGLAGTALAWPLTSGADNTSLDIAYINARAWTGRGPVDRTDAIGTIGERIVAIGAGAVRARTGKRTRVIDLEGAFVTPGLVDCHTHFTKASLMLSQPSLRDAASPQEFVARIGEAARRLPAGQWLQGGNWDQDRWGGKMPTREWIDAVTPETPVAVIRYDLHTLLLNSLALRLAGIDRNTPDVAGGVIERDASGEPTGIIKDAAKNLVLRAIGPATDAQIDAAIREGIALGLSKGITQTHTPELEWITFDAIERRYARGETSMRFYCMTPLKDWEKLAARIRTRGTGDDWFRWGGSKVVFDGSLGSRTALFYEAYDDDPSTRGIIVTDPKDLRRWMGEADRAGLQVATHAIGDRANDIVLDIIAEVARANGPRDRRFRIEHAQHLTQSAIPRFAKQAVIASIQPYHAIDDGRWAIKRVGPERLQTTYAFHSLIAAGARICCGSDWPVAPLGPLTGLKAAVLRETLDGRNPGGWFPMQRLTLAQTLAGYTTGAAYAGFTEKKLGLLAPGYLADLVVFDRDLFAIDPETLTDAKVLRTIVGGVQRYG
ncbi:amidohydrolase [Sphingomonas sp. MMSM20]|uniref:amidohydrolase n=1 Tax=Sphingomonas lycopersici TaxID=2951807 RepID=UPI0022380D3B|nr:amidohydrolase [Sphingomonas lycopersici]MCW6530802.1 amidohydrolase [Sphingomonas lycopersici]